MSRLLVFWVPNWIITSKSNEVKSYDLSGGLQVNFRGVIMRYKGALGGFRQIFGVFMGFSGAQGGFRGIPERSVTDSTQTDG